MRTSLDRRQFSLLTLAATLGAPLALGSPAASAASAPTDVMLAFDRLYIPPLFLTGSAGKSADGPARADAALQRLVAAWPALHDQLRAVWPQDAGWRRTLAAVQGHIRKANDLATRRQWPESHEALEAVRMDLKRARDARGLDYLLDRYTAFHEPMEHLAAAGTAAGTALEGKARAALEHHYAEARARWRAIETVPIDAKALRLSPAREAQLRKALADEDAALAALSEALRGRDDAALRKAAAATKPPFVRAYTAFGLPVGEAAQG
jgi:hypothetical protein